MYRMPFRHERPAGSSHRLIGESEAYRGDYGRRGPDLDLVIIAGRMPILAVGLDDGKGDASLFHFAVVPSSLSQPFRSPDFEPDEVIGVIDDAHLIRVRVTHSNASTSRQGFGTREPGVGTGRGGVGRRHSGRHREPPSNQPRGSARGLMTDYPPTS